MRSPRGPQKRTDTAPEPAEAERSTAKAFLRPARARRVLALLDRPGGRRKVTALLYHCDSWDPRYLREIPRGAQDHASIVRLLREAGAPRHCLAVVDDDELDGRWVDLELAVARLEWLYCGLLICVPGRLAYYKGEEPGRRCLLVRGGPTPADTARTAGS